MWVFRYSSIYTDGLVTKESRSGGGCVAYRKVVAKRSGAFAVTASSMLMEIEEVSAAVGFAGELGDVSRGGRCGGLTEHAYGRLRTHFFEENGRCSHVRGLT